MDLCALLDVTVDAVVVVVVVVTEDDVPGESNELRLCFLYLL